MQTVVSSFDEELKKNIDNFVENTLREGLTLSLSNYLLNGARSGSKIIPLHECIGTFIKDLFKHRIDLEINYSGNNDEFFNKEKKVNGQYYDKTVDICLSCKGNVIYCIGLKFITSNYKQNANNYFENMLGETVNIQEKNIPYSHILFFRYKTPYLDKLGKIKKIETISSYDMKKYINLMSDKDKSHRPKDLSLCIISETKREDNNSFYVDYIEASTIFDNDKQIDFYQNNLELKRVLYKIILSIHLQLS